MVLGQMVLGRKTSVDVAKLQPWQLVRLVGEIAYLPLDVSP